MAEAEAPDVDGETTTSGAGSASSRHGRRMVGGAAVLALLAVLLWAGREGADALPRSLDVIRELGPWAAVAFVALYAAATVAWVPGSILTLAAGALFGLLRGTAYTLMGATLGAALAFLIARHLARSTVERRLGGSPKLRAVDEAIGHQGAKVVLLLRLSPVFPFNALNYALGLTRVSFRRYVAASAIGMVPGTFLYVYAGHAAGQVAAGVSGAATRGPGYWALLSVGLLATVAVTVLITRSARRALDRDTSLEDGP